MSTACDKIAWVKKDRKLFDKNEKRLVSAPFHRVHIIDEYNHIMINVGIADQFRGSY